MFNIFDVKYKGKFITKRKLSALKARCKSLGILETKVFKGFDQACFDYCIKFLESKNLKFNPKI